MALADLCLLFEAGLPLGLLHSREEQSCIPVAHGLIHHSWKGRKICVSCFQHLLYFQVKHP